MRMLCPAQAAWRKCKDKNVRSEDGSALAVTSSGLSVALPPCRSNTHGLYCTRLVRCGSPWYLVLLVTEYGVE